MKIFLYEKIIWIGRIKFLPLDSINFRFIKYFKFIIAHTKEFGIMNCTKSFFLFVFTNKNIYRNTLLNIENIFIFTTISSFLFFLRIAVQVKRSEERRVGKE